MYEEICSSMEAIIRIKGGTRIQVKISRMGDHEDVVSFDISKSPSDANPIGKKYSGDLNYQEASALYDILGDILGK